MTGDNNRIVELYDNRFDEFGHDVRTVGWGSKADQILRFDMLFRDLPVKGCKILDMGCGLGDMVPYLDRITGGDYDYVGVDVAPKLIGFAEQKFAAKHRRFILGDIAAVDLEQCDIAVLSGALSFRTDDNITMAQSVIKRMHGLAKIASSLNFLSSYVDYQTDKNFHYQPEEMFGFAKRLTRWVNLYHDYPLWEFTLQLRHQPREENN